MPEAVSIAPAVPDSLKLELLSTPVGVLGTGDGGGVELTVRDVAAEMLRRGHQVEVVAPAGSALAGIPVREVGGNLQSAAQSRDGGAAICMPADPVLGNMWAQARALQPACDLLVNFAFDWLPFYLTPFFQRSIAHFLSMGSMQDALDPVAAQVAERFPGTVGVYTASQAATFPFAAHCRCLGSGIDLAQYRFCAQPDAALGWVGRIAPEKGLEDAIAAAQQAGMPLRIWGKIQDEAYWQGVCRQYPDAPFEYRGFLATEALQAQLRRCQGLLVTPRWLEAFGNVAIEALACGVPVIAYRRGGPSEIVRHGRTGYLVEPDRVAGLVEGIQALGHLDRRACRQQAEAEYSREALGDRFEAWFRQLTERTTSSP